MTSYFIFKTDHLTGKTTNVCGGSHETEDDCYKHWICYLYGFMDAALELCDCVKSQMLEGSRKRSFILSVDGKKKVEYFMLLDQEGHDLIAEISK